MRSLDRTNAGTMLLQERLLMMILVAVSVVSAANNNALSALVSTAAVVLNVYGVVTPTTLAVVLLSWYSATQDTANQWVAILAGGVQLYIFDVVFS